MFRRLFVFVLRAVLAATARPPRLTISWQRAFTPAGLAGNAQAVIDCIATLEQMTGHAPDDQLGRVYLGSAYTLRSRDLGFGKAKLDALRKGIALMDEAAAAAPGDASVQLTRAVTNEALPAFLGRRYVARATARRTGRPGGERSGETETG